MKGDFSRLTFDPRKQFTRVLMQQGRVQLDADWNEQAAILLHYLERLAADLIGPHGGPVGDPGFEIVADRKGGKLEDLKIGQGRYYVDGLLCENPLEMTYRHLHGLPGEEDLAQGNLLVYLDVWERHVTHLEDPSIREVALGGPDTATRAQVVWRVRIADRPPGDEDSLDDLELSDDTWRNWVDLWQPPRRGSLRARARPGEDPTDPCTASPDARYRGPENQLYRVEIHRGGKVGKGATEGEGATFKWSRDNGSRAFPIVSIGSGGGSGTIVTLEHLGHEQRPGLAAGDWVEVMQGNEILRDGPDPLREVLEVDGDRLQVTLARKPKEDAEGPSEAPEPQWLLRRWDHGRSKRSTLSDDGAVSVVEGKVVEGKEEEVWLDLEDGIQVSFQPADPAHVYRPGDYWLIPARTTTGDVEWPGSPEAPEAQPPHGVRHRYAPLALIPTDETKDIVDLRRSFGFLAQPLPGELR